MSITGFDLENQQIEKAKLDVLKGILEQLKNINGNIQEFKSLYEFKNQIE